jgi:hypothetical protein
MIYKYSLFAWPSAIINFMPKKSDVSQNISTQPGLKPDMSNLLFLYFFIFFFLTISRKFAFEQKNLGSLLFFL